MNRVAREAMRGASAGAARQPPPASRRGACNRNFVRCPVDFNATVTPALYGPSHPRAGDAAIRLVGRSPTATPTATTTSTTMRPLIVLTGQGVARADGLNLTRRTKAIARVDVFASSVERRDRQNLDVLLERCASAGDGMLDEVLRGMRAICLKERRSTARKAAHHGLFAALAEVAESRLVLHLTTNVDGLTTAFAVREFGASWPPFHGPASTDGIVAEAQAKLDARRGMLHFPVHGEAGLVVSAADTEMLRTFYGDPRLLRSGGPWVPSLRIGLASGVRDIEERLAPARLGYALLDALLEPGAGRCHYLAVPQHVGADLLVIGYGADERGARALNPFERRIRAFLATGRRDAAARWHALVYRPDERPRTAEWYAARGFTVLPYDDDELARVARQAMARPLPAARCTGPDCATRAESTPARS
ncbi:MAG: hypothetical protein AB1689_27165 [Thermodesulfobacteriota bacterium]